MHKTHRRKRGEVFENNLQKNIQVKKQNSEKFKHKTEGLS